MGVNAQATLQGHNRGFVGAPLQPADRGGGLAQQEEVPALELVHRWPLLSAGSQPRGPERARALPGLLAPCPPLAAPFLPTLLGPLPRPAAGGPWDRSAACCPRGPSRFRGFISDMGISVFHPTTSSPAPVGLRTPISNCPPDNLPPASTR